MIQALPAKVGGAPAITAGALVIPMTLRPVLLQMTAAELSSLPAQHICYATASLFVQHNGHMDTAPDKCWPTSQAVTYMAISMWLERTPTNGHKYLRMHQVKTASMVLLMMLFNTLCIAGRRPPLAKEVLSMPHLCRGVHGLVVQVHGAPAAINIAHIQLPRHKGILAADVLTDVPRVLFILILIAVILGNSPLICDANG